MLSCCTIAEVLKNKLNGFTPEIAIILGSGLGSLADKITNPTYIKYNEIPDFPQSSVSGHKGQFVCGYLQNKKIICMQGRVHLYEGNSPQTIRQIIHGLKLLGVNKLIVTNAAGSLNKNISAGSIMMITDHINLSSFNPLIGTNDETLGPRFPDMSNAYSQNFQNLIRQTAAELNIPLKEGTYLMVSGPNFETAAEVKAFGLLGGDAVGMSTVHEVISAVHCGMEVMGFSVITNLGTGLSDNALSHEETLSMGQKASENLSLLINTILERI